MHGTVGEEVGAEPIVQRARPYAYYALALLTLCNITSFIDRQIVSILAQSIKADLHLNDAQLGFLLGTAFAIFYAVVGIAIGRLADMLSRKYIMALGLTVWSGMTALGGAATNFATLGIARFGVGAGEATAIPCAYSLICGYFPPRNRAAMLGVMISGTFIGSALAMVLGGMILQGWPHVCTRFPEGACAVAGWKAALIAVGLPGIPLAILIACLREPPRGDEGQPKPRVVPAVLHEFAATVPPFTVLTLLREVGGGAALRNLGLALGLAAVAALLTHVTGDAAQWWSIAVGAYALISWVRVQKQRDPALHRLTFGCSTFARCLVVSCLLACISGALSAWSAAYALRTFHVTPAQIGLALGFTTAGASAIGVILGGWISDRWSARDTRAPLFIGLIAMLCALPVALFMMNAATVGAYVGGYFVYCFCISTWPGAYAAMVQSLVLPRMRSTAASASALVTIVVASGMGPYWAGKVSVWTGSLRLGILSLQMLVPFAIVAVILGARRLRTETPAGREALAASVTPILETAIVV